MSSLSKNKRWITYVLLLAACYNIIWGISTIFFPNWFFNFAGMDVPIYPEIWQCVGMIVGVYGIGYAIAAFKPFENWALVLVGLLGKIFGPIGFIKAFASGSFTLAAGWTILFNDIIWWIPFILILKAAYDYHKKQVGAYIDNENIILQSKLRDTITNSGFSIMEQSHMAPTLLVFLRHFGCTFCREALADIAEKKMKIEENGTELVLVHMVDEETADNHLKQFGLEDMLHVSDENCELYKHFKLNKGSLQQLFGLKVWKRAFLEGIYKRFGIGRETGDSMQMPGAFLIHKGMVVQSYRHRSAADKPDYERLSQCVFSKNPSLAGLVVS